MVAHVKSITTPTMDVGGPSRNAGTPTPVTRISAVSVKSSDSVAGPLYAVATKEWVIPPRPKPGRKPVEGEPPTVRHSHISSERASFQRHLRTCSLTPQAFPSLPPETQVTEPTVSESVQRARGRSSHIVGGADSRVRGGDHASQCSDSRGCSRMEGSV